jgi:hypothetical protein
MTVFDQPGPMLDVPLAAGLVEVMAGGCALLVVMFTGLFVRRLIADHRRETRQAASLFAVREIFACVQGEGPIDPEHLRAVLRAAPIEAVLQFVRLQRGDHLALVIDQAEQAGVFDPALEALRSKVLSRKLAAIRQLQFARGTRFRSAVLGQVIRGVSPQVRCEALYCFITMGSTPPIPVLGLWVDGTGPAMTPRHGALFDLIAARFPASLGHLASCVDHPDFRARLIALAAARPPILAAPAAAATSNVTRIDRWQRAA